MRPPFFQPSRAAAPILALLTLASSDGCKRSSNLPSSSSLRLNEVKARSAGCPVTDAAGKPVPAGFAEIHNPSPRAVGLAGHTLSDRLDNPNKFEFPRGAVIGPGEFLIVLLMNREDCAADCEEAAAECRQEEAGNPAGLLACETDLGTCLQGCDPSGLVTDFNLNDDDPGETLYLFAEEGDLLLDRMGVREQPATASNGRDPGTGEIGVIFMPTPGMPNEPINRKPLRFDPRLPAASIGAAPEAPILIEFAVAKDLEAPGEIEAQVGFAAAESCSAAIDASRLLPVAVELVNEEVFEETRTGAAGNAILVPALRRSYRAAIPAPGACGKAFSWRVQARDGTTEVAHESCSVSCEVLPTVVISEYQPQNTQLLFRYESRSGELDTVSPDWIELFNYGNEPVDVRHLGLAGGGALHEGRFSNWLLGREGGVTERLLPRTSLVFLADNDGGTRRRDYYRLDAPDDVDLEGPVHRSTRFQLNPERDLDDCEGDGFDRFALVKPLEPDNPASTRGGTIIDEAILDFTRSPIRQDESAARFSFPASGSPPDVLRPGTVTECPTFKYPNAPTCEVEPAFGDLVAIDPTDGKRCPRAGEAVGVRASVHFDRDTPADRVRAELEFRIDEGPPTVLSSPPGFVLERAADQSAAAPARTLYTIRALIPGQAQGALVSFLLRARDERIAADPPPVPDGAPPVAADAVLDEMNVAHVAPGSSLRYLVGFARPAGGPRVNEVLPRNTLTALPYFDQVLPFHHRYLDYVEIHNPADTARDLTGFYLTDDLDRPRKWQFPAGASVPPRGFIIGYFGPCPMEQGQCLVPDFIEIDAFPAGDCTGSIHLIAPDEKARGANCEIDALAWDEDLTDKCAVDVAAGRICDGEERVRTLRRPSPETPNVLTPVIVDAFHEVLTPDLGANACVPPRAQVVRLNATIFLDQDFREALRAEPDLLRASFEVDLGEGPMVEITNVITCGPECVQPPMGSGYVAMTARAFPGSPFPPVVNYRLRLEDCRGPLTSDTFSFGTTAGERPQVAVNEINRGFPIVPGGAARPWIEIHNRSPVPADLSGAFLSDDPRQPRKAMLPGPAVIPPGGVVLVLTSDGDPVPPHWQVDFEWSKPSGTIFLIDAVERGSCILDEFPFADLPAGISVGRDPDGTGAIARLPAPSPGRLNAAAADVFVRGDATNDLKVNLTDMVRTLAILFAGDPDRPPCEDALDANDDGLVNATDPIYLGNSVTGIGPAPPAPFPQPGPDPTPDGLRECDG